MAKNDDAVPAPFDDYRTVVRPEWIDHNGRMNMGYYMVVCDLATDAPWTVGQKIWLTLPAESLSLLRVTGGQN